MTQIFEQERLDGLSDLLSSNSVIYQSVARCSTVNLTKTEKITAAIKSANPNQVDLFYLDSILSSVGWNANDDVFDPEQMWAARNTPEDKQFNYMHDESDIIGHITGSYVLDEDGKIYEGDDAPEKYHLACQSVLYKKWSDETLQERMDKIVSEIAEDKWFVSMECLFPNFDYAIITPKGEQKVIARTKDTAFLTKHLRAYGGSGEYNGNKVGRLLKNFVFSGKGLVDNPANKNSIILSFKGAKASKNILGVKMDELELLKKEVADLKTANQVLTDKVKVAEQQEINSEIEAAKAKVTDLEKTVSDMQKTIDELKNVISLKDADNTKAAEKVETLTKELETAKSELNTIKVETEKKTRAAKLKEAGVSDEDASKIVDQFITADVALFDTVVAAYQTRKPAEPEQKEKDVKITEDDVEKTQAGVVSDGVDDASLQKTKAAVFTFLQNNLSKGK
jgi:uncharacterized coiled-coil protein SlyX